MRCHRYFTRRSTAALRRPPRAECRERCLAVVKQYATFPPRRPPASAARRRRGERELGGAAAVDGARSRAPNEREQLLGVHLAAHRREGVARGGERQPALGVGAAHNGPTRMRGVMRAAPPPPPLHARPAPRRTAARAARSCCCRRRACASSARAVSCSAPKTSTSASSSAPSPPSAPPASSFRCLRRRRARRRAARRPRCSASAHVGVARGSGPTRATSARRAATVAAVANVASRSPRRGPAAATASPPPPPPAQQQRVTPRDQRMQPVRVMAGCPSGRRRPPTPSAALGVGGVATRGGGGDPWKRGLLRGVVAARQLLPRVHGAAVRGAGLSTTSLSPSSNATPPTPCRRPTGRRGRAARAVERRSRCLRRSRRGAGARPRPRPPRRAAARVRVRLGGARH